MQRKIPPAAKLIDDPFNFCQGTLAKDADGNACGTSPSLAHPVQFDCLGAILWAYRKMHPDDRHEVAKRVFSACHARYGHTRLGKLSHDESFDLLKDCGA